jgi:hypothetical protein
MIAFVADKPLTFFGKINAFQCANGNTLEITLILECHFKYLQRVIATICYIVRTSIYTNSTATFPTWSEFSTKKIFFL